jgi:asparagine synthetase B (glutamine-hydrolysing)
MSKALYVIWRTLPENFKARADRTEQRFKLLNNRLVPDVISPRPPHIVRDGLLQAAVFNPSHGEQVKDSCICLGNVLDTPEGKPSWEQMSTVPDGTYAIFRFNGTSAELLADAVANRTIWYVQTDTCFLASTSQRAIVSFLESFEPNPQAITWMLSSGLLAPGSSWDRRIQAVPPGGLLRLDIQNWTTSLRQDSVQSLPEPGKPMKREEHILRLQRAIEDTLAQVQLPTGRWVLPLSGGYDSRALLILLGQREGLSCVTWGTADAPNDPQSDAAVAKRLAEHYKLDFRYFALEPGEEPMETIIERYLAAGEGRGDHIRGYLDGFRTWKTLFEEGVDGIIRGDEDFGGHNTRASEYEVRRSFGMMRLSDYENIPAAVVNAFPPQLIPAHLEYKPEQYQDKKQSFLNWYKRLIIDYSTPGEAAMFNDIYTGFVEVMNPFLSRKVLEVSLSLPIQLRDYRLAFKTIVEKMSPPIPFATHHAVMNNEEFVQSPGLIALIQDELSSSSAREVLPLELLEFLRGQVKAQPEKKPLRSLKREIYFMIYQMLGMEVSNFVKRYRGKARMDVNWLAFDAYLICRIQAMYRADACCFSSLLETQEKQ